MDKTGKKVGEQKTVNHW